MAWEKQKDATKEEMLKFPFYHVDILDMWAYVYDLIVGMKEMNFFSDWYDVFEMEDRQPNYYDSRDRITGY